MLIAKPQEAAASLAELAAWVVKDGVALGGLSPGLREQALGVAWSGLPAGVLNEKAVNVALLAQLAGAARFLGTDHVELRRWLVDSGWLKRDGFGREYHRVLLQDLSASQQPVAAALAAVDVAAWAQSLRARRGAARESRRHAWQAAQGTSPAAALQRGQRGDRGDRGQRGDPA